METGRGELERLWMLMTTTASQDSAFYSQRIRRETDVGFYVFILLGIIHYFASSLMAFPFLSIASVGIFNITAKGKQKQQAKYRMNEETECCTNSRETATP